MSLSKEWKARQRQAQVTVPESEIVEGVQRILAKSMLSPEDMEKYATDVMLFGAGFVKITTDGATYIPREEALMPLISKGEKITCTNGHVIGEALEDVNIGDLNWGAKFGNWTQDDIPRIGATEKPKCEICGADFIGSATWVIHFQSGWKP